MRTCAYTSATPGITAELAVATEASFIDVEVDQKNDFLIDRTPDAVNEPPNDPVSEHKLQTQYPQTQTYLRIVQTNATPVCRCNRGAVGLLPVG